jgi:hypothetical protein
MGAMVNPRIELWLIALQAVQVVFLLLHDWVPLGRLTNLAAVRTIDSTQKLLWTTLLSALPYAAGLAFSIAYLPHWPMSLRIYLEWLYTISLLMIAFAWWVPYLSAADSDRAARYRTRFAGTLSFLPKRHGFAPDALHTSYHAVVLATAILLLFR